MGHAHLCIQCGLSLARVHAPPDPHYGLPVVVCPRCHAASVRRPFAGDATRRAAVRVWHTAARLFIRVVLLLGLSVLTVGMSGEVAGMLERACRDQPLHALLMPDDHGTRARFAAQCAGIGAWTLVVWVIAWIAAGLTTGMAFPHWRLRGFLLGIPAAAIGLVVLIIFFGVAIAWGEGHDPFTGLRLRTIHWRELLAFLVPALTGFMIAAALYPLGRRMVVRLRSRRSLASRRLRKARRRKMQAS